MEIYGVNKESQMMKAARFYGADQPLKIEDIPEPIYLRRAKYAQAMRSFTAHKHSQNSQSVRSLSAPSLHFAEQKGMDHQAEVESQ